MARHTKLTPELALRLAEAMRKLPIKYACDLCDIPDRTYREWVERGEAGEEPFADFLRLARSKRAEYVKGRLNRIEAASREDWKASAWYLERCHPEHFRPQSAQDLDVKSGGKPIEVQVYIPANGRETGDPSAAGTPGDLPGSVV